jgi:hypothetical protein
MYWEPIQGIELERHWDLIYMFKKIILAASKKIGRRWVTVEVRQGAKRLLWS